MPFTVSHIAGIIPFTWLRLPVGTLVIGSMIPDLPIFLNLPRLYPLFHSPLGALTIDVLAGALVCFLWVHLWRAPLLALIPASVVRFWPPTDIKISWRNLIALLIGISTHIVWDNFTHSYGFFVSTVPFLQRTVGESAYTVFHVLQHLSSAVGLIVVVFWCYVKSKHQQSDYEAIPKAGSDRVLWRFWCAISLIATGCAFTFASHDYLERFVFEVIVIGMDTVMICLTIASLVIARKSQLAF